MAHFDWCLYQVTSITPLKCTKIDIEADDFVVSTQEGDINLEELIDDYLRLKAEENTAEELVEEYRKEEIEEALADAPLDDPMHHSWDRYLKLANHKSS